MTDQEICGACDGSRRMPRDPDIGADQECFVCDGSGVIATPPAAAPASAVPQGEPVMWVMRAHETGQLNPARPHQKAKHPKIWSDAFPLYAATHAAPSQPVTLTDMVPRAALQEVERERDYYKVRTQTMHEYLKGEVWYWQGDGQDHPESWVNSLPVVIRADQLRELMTRYSDCRKRPRCGLDDPCAWSTKREPSQPVTLTDSYAGVIAWIGDKQCKLPVTEDAIKHEHTPGVVMRNAAHQCVQEVIAALREKEQAK